MTKTYFSKIDQNRSKMLVFAQFLVFKITKNHKKWGFRPILAIFLETFFYHLKDLEITRILKKNFPKKANSAAEI